MVFSAQKKMETNNRDDLCKKLSCLVQDAHTALADLRSHNAEQAFSHALDLLETCTPKVNAQASNMCLKRKKNKKRLSALL